MTEVVVSHHDFAWLQSHSGVSTSEIEGSDGYYRYQSDTDDTLRTTFDSVHSVQRVDGSGDTRYHGNRGLAGDGWNSNWYEETPSGGGIEVSQGSYHLALTHDDDRPNAYDVTVASGSAASVELPGPYRLPTNSQANTPPSGALGPGGFSPPEDPSEVAGLRDQVAAAGSSAAAANAAHNANFLVMVQLPGNPETPGTPASEGSLQGSATMADYAGSQSSLPNSANPAAIAAGAADETMVAESDRSLIAVGNIPHFLRGMALGFGDGAIGFVDGAVTAVRGVGQYAYFVWVHWTDGADAAAGTSAGQAIDSAAVLTLKYGPEVARIIQEIHAGQLSPETWGLIAQVQPLVDEILDAIAEEFDRLSVEEQAELIGRITTATIVEVVAFVGTAGAGTALSVAAKTGKLANITSKLGGYSSKLTNKVSAAIGKFVNKVDEGAPKSELPILNLNFTPKPTTLGRVGEKMADFTGNKTRILINGRNRIPDGFDELGRTLSEVKNVNRLSYTRQLRDYADYARQNGFTFELFVRPDTRLSGPLLEAIRNGDIILRHIPGI